MTDATLKLRSAEWFGTADKNGFMYRSWMKNQGIPDHEFDGRPIIGICQSGSELTPCNRIHLSLAARVKDGIRDAGGVPIEFPLHPIQESCRRPTAALDRNLAYLGLVEILSGYPFAPAMGIAATRAKPIKMIWASSELCQSRISTDTPKINATGTSRLAARGR